jgi:hypothetical protein
MSRERKGIREDGGMSRERKRIDSRCQRRRGTVAPVAPSRLLLTVTISMSRS